MSGRWKQERDKDQFYRLAKERGYRSRSAFKLLQMIRKYRFMKSGDKVVDLGAAPGGWLQVSRQTVGKKGFVLGVDMDQIQECRWVNVKTLVEDVTSESLPPKILDLAPSGIDVVISDISPNITGAWDVDHARQLHLAERCFEIAKKVLKKRGNFLCKLFHGPDLKSYESSVAECFEKVRLVKPSASKQRSSEIYLLALHFRG